MQFVRTLSDIYLSGMDHGLDGRIPGRTETRTFQRSIPIYADSGFLSSERIFPGEMSVCDGGSGRDALLDIAQS